MELRQRARRIGLQRSELALENRAASVIFVAQIDVDRIDADGPRCDDRAFKKTMWIAFEVVPILERARLTFVDVDGHQARRGFRGDDLPLAAGGEAGATKTAQPRVLHDADYVSGIALTADARCG